MPVLRFPAQAGCDILYGAATVRGSDGSVSASGFGVTGGLPAPTRNGPGSYTFVLSPGIDPGVALVLRGINGIGASAANEIQVALTDATHLNVRTFQGGVATDKNFWIQVRRVIPSINISLLALGPGMQLILVTNDNRPAANTLAMGTMVWNSTSHTPQWAGGPTDNNWYDANGVIV